jgi:hypothetical protein
MRVSATAAALSYSHGTADNPVSIEDAVDAVPESSTSLPNLVKPSKIAFAAAQAIRICIGNGGIADGFFVLNSIRYAAYRKKPSALPFKTPGLLYSKADFEAAALQFGPDVSQRLPAHVLLHGLVRNGLAEPAFELAKLMMAEGVVIRSATLEKVMESLVLPSSPRRRKYPRLQFAYPHPSIPMKLASDVLFLRPSMMGDQRTRFALQLLFLARRHRQRRTDSMFKLFMAASLLNGELIIFSLLFGWTCRDWQTAYSLENNVAAIPDHDELNSSSQVIAARYRLAHLRSEAIIPDKDSLNSALEVISTILSRDGVEPKPTHARLVALQALGNFAGLLDRRQIPFPEISSLLRTMYKCPRVEDEIWIVGAGGCPERIKAHEYLHRVLFNLVRALPTQDLRLRHPRVAPDAIVKNHRYDMLPPLRVTGYNTLLHYALRQRLSPALGEVVLSHMLKKRQTALAPDMVTANILLRSGTLMRRYDIAADVLASIGTVTFPLVPPDPGDEPSALPLEAIIHSGHVPAVQSRMETVVNSTSWGSKLGRIRRQKIHIPDLPSEPDIYTVTSYISYLTSTGQPRAVKKLLFRIIPELDRTLYPTNLNLKKHHRPERVALYRAMTLGPVFFTVVLDALRKSGQPALADRVWQLGKKAERFSWLRRRRHLPKCEPWIFGPEVYTIMMTCYGNLARRRRPWHLELHPGKRISKEVSRYSVWAAFLYECQKLPSPLPSHQVQLLLHRFMESAALGVFRRFFNLHQEHKQGTLGWLQEEDLPKPDSRLFNAALRVFRPRGPCKQKSWYKGQLRHAKYILEQYGVQPQNTGWNAPLQEVVEHMLAHGYPLPLDLRYLFVGRLEGTDLPSVRRPDRGPYGYRKYKHRPFTRHRLPTCKERGLPVSRAYRYILRARTRRRKRRRKTRRRVTTVASCEEM